MRKPITQAQRYHHIRGAMNEQLLLLSEGETKGAEEQMPTTLVDIDFLEQLASRIESLVYTVEQRHLPGVREQVGLQEAEERSSFRQGFEVDYQQWRQLTTAMLRTGKDL